jgi:hypothetical protein
MRGTGEAGVLDRRRVDGEDHVDLAAKLLGDTGGDRHPRPRSVALGGVLEVRRPDAQNDLVA